MTDVKIAISSFESGLDPTETATPMVQSNDEVEIANVGSDSSEDENDASSRNGNVEAAAETAYVVKKPHANSKLILQNMEEVLNSVKKQHRQKQRRKKEQRKLAQMEAQQVTGAEERFQGGESSVVGVHQNEKSAKRNSKKPLQEKTTQENGLQHAKSKAKHRERKSPLKSASPVSSSNSILKHFQHTPKKNEAVATQEANKTGNSNIELDVEVVEVKSPAKSDKSTNAFEVMMNARNKSIGSNTPGKELFADNSAIENELAVTDKVKRKLMLQEWAELKGGAKRKLEEESRAVYVDKQMKNRAKRFKTLLTNGLSPKSPAACSTPTENAIEKHKENTKQRQSKCANTRVKKRKRTQRLSSVESVESLDKNPVELDADTTEFLSKLSSPTKKRDSLLGYFPKKESPTELSAKVGQLEVTPINSSKTKLETSVARARRSTTRRCNVNAHLNTQVKGSETATTKPTAASATSDVQLFVSNTGRDRPKRSCAGRSRYDYDLQESPAKAAKQPNRSQTPLRAHRNSSKPLKIIDLDDSNSELQREPANSVTPQTPVKLAPLFTRAMPKPGVDPVLLLARQEFLMSGVPDRVRLEQAKQKQCEQSYEEAAELFPKTSHVQQLSAAEAQFLHSHKPNTLKLKLYFETDLYTEDTLPTVSGNSRKSGKTKARSSIGLLANCTAKDFQAPALGNAKVSRLLNLHWPMPIIENKRLIVRSWKAEFDRFPTYKCYNQMREKYRYFSAIDSAQDTEQVTESFVVTRRTRRSLEAEKFDPEAEEEKPPATAPNGELLFTEKYKPLMFDQVLVNLTPVTQLREFLNNWSSDSSSRNSQTLDDSMDSANDSCSNQQLAISNAVVLLGPISSGKTSAVFALANEMNFNVLEINAGMKRTGKKLIQELQEATQSHQIRKEGAAAQGKSHKPLLKMSLNGLKSKKQSSQSLEISECPTTSLYLSQSSRKSLILIEDADLVFEQLDAGFTDAIYTLAASSKRPVIIVASNPDCAHLQRLMSQNTINFVLPHTLNMARFLSVLSLVENCPVALDDLVSLYLYNGKDIRKTLLELQFFIQSGGDQHMLREAHKKEPTTSTDKQTQQPPYFASPSKRRFSEDCNATQLDEQLHNDAVAVASRSTTIQTKQAEIKQSTYMHRTLFEFYTVAQNEKWRVPFPIDFRLLRINLSALFKVAHAIEETTVGPAAVAGTATKRKSRSPKKAWLNSVTSSNRRGKAIAPLDALCDFYEHTSVATLLGARQEAAYAHCADGLVPHVAEQIAHSLVEQAITVNLTAEVCPYNLFDTASETHLLCDYLGTQMLRTQNARCLDYEPALRAICRSEKRRATLDRRTTRFYHYLRNSAVNMCSFSLQQYDAACDVLQLPTVEDEIATAALVTPTTQT